MSETSLSCYRIDTEPYSLVLPSDCIADVIEAPKLIADPSQKASWMAGYVEWNGQELPLLCFENLLNDDFERPDTSPVVTVLQPIPKAARKAYTAILSFGKVTKFDLASDVQDADFPEGFDRRYVEGALSLDGDILLIPRLAALGVAFSYY